MTSSKKVVIVVYLGRSSGGQSVGHKRVSRDIGYSELISKLYQITRINSNEYALKIYGALCVNNEINHINIDNDDDLGFFFAPDSGNRYVNLHVKTEELQSSVFPDISSSSEYYQYASYLRGDDIFGSTIVTQDLDNMGINDFTAGTSENIMSHLVAGRSTSYDFATGPAENDPVVDSFGANELQDSEPNDSGSSSDSDKDDCDINSIRAGYNQNVEGPTPSNPITPPSASYIHPIIPFYSATYPKQLVDSFQIPKKQRFYDASEGELTKGMVFTDKKNLQFVVKDFSVRVARHEYMVVKSTPTLWKVRCKSSREATQCSWWLCARFKERLGLWQITRCGGHHTCLMNYVLVDHHIQLTRSSASNNRS